MTSQQHVPTRFIAGVMSDVSERFKSAMKAGIWPEYPDYFKLLGEHYDVVCITRNGLLSWQVRLRLPSERFTPVGAGWFRFQTRPERRLCEIRAALKQEHQGKGLYPRVLRAIRFAYGRPLVSDLYLTEANRKAWLAAGGVPNIRMRVNPQSWVAVSWLATEGRIPRMPR
jgi:hypothetical protein